MLLIPFNISNFLANEIKDNCTKEFSFLISFDIIVLFITIKIVSPNDIAELSLFLPLINAISPKLSPEFKTFISLFSLLTSLTFKIFL